MVDDSSEEVDSLACSSLEDPYVNMTIGKVLFAMEEMKLSCEHLWDCGELGYSARR